MIKDVILSLHYIAGVNEAGKDIRKSRRFPQVRFNLTDQEAQEFKALITTLTDETYYEAELTEIKIVE